MSHFSLWRSGISLTLLLFPPVLVMVCDADVMGEDQDQDQVSICDADVMEAGFN